MKFDQLRSFRAFTGFSDTLELSPRKSSKNNMIAARAPVTMCVVTQSQMSCYTTAAANRWDVALKLQLSAKVHNHGGCRRTVPPEHRCDGIESITQAAPSARHTETKNVCYTGERARTTDHSMFKSIQWIMDPIKSFPPFKAKISRSIPPFKQYPSTCLMQMLSPEGSLVHVSDVPLITAFQNRGAFIDQDEYFAGHEIVLCQT